MLLHLPCYRYICLAAVEFAWLPLRFAWLPLCMRLTAAVWLQEFEALGDATTGASGAIDPDFARSSYTKHFLKQPTLQECANRAGQQASVQHTCPLL